MEPTPMLIPNSSSVPQDESRDHLVKNMLEAITNLIYLSKLEAESPDKVRNYMDMADSCMKKVVSTLYS